MRPELLDLMKCPYCGSDFKVGETREAKEGRIISGVVRCECSKFPILEGILNLKVGLLNEYLVKFIMEDRIREAAGLSLWSYTESLCKLVTFLESKGMKGRVLGKILLGMGQRQAERVYRKYADTGISFYNLLGNHPAETYLKHRFSAETFWSLYAFIPVLKEKRGRILDLGCGAGHASFVISDSVEPEQLVCLDSMFSNLYLVKKYFAKDAEFICFDANNPLPFKEGIFDSILMLDAFHYIQARTALAVEMQRVLSSQGLLLLLHLHNSLSYNPAAGKPLSPLGWVNLFQQLPVRALPERDVVEDFILRDRLDLAKEFSEAELNSSSAIGIIGTRDRLLYKGYDEVGRYLLNNKSNLIVNPIYNIDLDAEGLVLELNMPGEKFRNEYPVTEKYLLPKYRLEERLARILKGRAVNIESGKMSADDSTYLEELMRKFILINAPENYY